MDKAGKKWAGSRVPEMRNAGCLLQGEGAEFVSGGVLSFSSSGEQCVTFDQRQRSSDSDHCYGAQPHITQSSDLVCLIIAAVTKSKH